MGDDEILCWVSLFSAFIYCRRQSGQNADREAETDEHEIKIRVELPLQRRVDLNNKTRK